MAAAIATLAALVLGGLWLRPAPAAVFPGVVARFVITLPDRQALTSVGRSVVAVSPDGLQIAYVAEGRLFVRAVGELGAREVAGTDADGAISTPVFSPDGRSLVYSAASNNMIKRIPVQGGTPVVVCDNLVNVAGISWTGNDLVFGAGVGGVLKVSANGGKPEPLASVADTELAYGPQVLPGGKAVLFSTTSRVAGGSGSTSAVVLQPLPGGERRTLLADGAFIRYVPSGHLLYAQFGVVMMQRFNLERLNLSGPATPVLQGVRRGNAGVVISLAQISVSDNGTVAYVSGPTNPTTAMRKLVITDRAGTITPIPGAAAARYLQPRVSARGDALAVEVDEGDGADIHFYRLAGDAAVQKVTIDGRSRRPIWSPDGRITYQSSAAGDAGIWAKTLGGAAVRLTTAEKGVEHTPEAWSPDSHTLVFSQFATGVPGRAFTLWTLTDGRVTPFAAIDSAEPFSVSFSPDGNWVAYSRTEQAGGSVLSPWGVFIRRFPDDGNPYQVPKERVDFHPRWTPDGKEIVFAPSVGRLSAVRVTPGPVPSFGPPVAISAAAAPDRLSVSRRDWDLLKDGRFVAAIPASDLDATSLREIRVITNWFSEWPQQVSPR